MKTHRQRREISLQAKIMFFSAFIVTLSVLSVSYGFLKTMEASLLKEVENNVLNTARIVARMPTVIGAFETAHPEETIDPLMKVIRSSSRDVQFITVTNIEGIRYSHPNPEQLLKPFAGGDEGPVLQEGSEYISVAQGTLGISTRALTPIIHPAGHRLGMVAVGTLNRNIEQATAEMRWQVYRFALIGLVLGHLGSIWMAKHLKKILLGLEPYEISKLLKERNGILKAIKEGVMAIDADGNVSMINEAARTMLSISPDKQEGMHIGEIMPESKMPRVLKTGQAELDIQDVMNGVPIMVNRIPITNAKNEIVGVISSFRLRDELTTLAEQLTGARMLVDSLRANTHEFMSKMHVLLGLLQLKNYDLAEKYILEETESQQQITSQVIRHIKEPAVAALIIGRFSAARESGLTMMVDPASQLSVLQGRISSNALVTIIGNLLNNAFDALNQRENGQVTLSIQETDHAIMLQVVDNGEGMSCDIQEKIFNRGFSTREGDRGTGLFLVNQVVGTLHGTIRVQSKTGNGTTFWVRLPKQWPAVRENEGEDQ
ncbi:sensor histidine kinase [Anoxynatronum sibiricum]|uniref:histidine kinase n=1 Tax=Anoxynatronum sibiricum TaxID=210623 RepID=A0ABU9VPP4_9CLOT